MGMGRPRWEGLVEPIPISSASKGLTEANFPSLRGVFSHVTEVLKYENYEAMVLTHRQSGVTPKPSPALKRTLDSVGDGYSSEDYEGTPGVSNVQRASQLL
jgi:hypothetical protein